MKTFAAQENNQTKEKGPSNKKGELKVSVSIGDRIQAAIDHMDKGDVELALSDVCIAIDITSQKYLNVEKSSRSTYKQFLKDNMWIILTAGFGGVVVEDIKIPFQHPEIKGDDQGYCTLEDVIYHVMRCGLLHGTGENDGLVWTKEVILACHEGKLNISPTFIWGMMLAVITCPCNQQEHVNDTSWISMASFKYLVNDLWGKKESVRMMIKSQFSVQIEG